MSCLRILADNYADPDLYANLLYSSQNASFPATNLLARVRRSKVWRSSGYWKVDSSNNTIIFREAVGVDLTATITVGEYTTTTFMAAVKTALEDAGVATYTITQNSNYKFVLASNLGGGASVFQLRFADTLNTSESLLGFENTNLSGSSSYTGDFLRINTEEYITFDLGLATTITDFAMTGFRNQSIKLSESGTFTVQGNYTNDWTNPAYSEVMTYDDEVMYVANENGLFTSPLRYWRILFSDQNPLGYIEVGAMSLAVSFLPTRGRVQFPLSTSLDDKSRVVVSEGGQTFSEVLEKTAVINATWRLMTKEDIEEMVRIFEVYGISHPFFISIDPDAVFSSSANRQIKFVKFAKEPSYSLDSPNNFTFSAQFAEQL